MKKVLAALLIAGLLPASSAALAKPACFDNEQYHVVAQDLDDGPGQRIAVFRRAASGALPPCAATPAKASPPALAVPEESYAVGLKQDFLLLDQGTGPNGRELLLWDLRSARVAWRSPFDELLPERSSDTLRFWRPEKTPADEARCPQLRQWRRESLGAQMQQQVRVHLPDLSVQPLGRWRCSATQ